MIWGSRRERKNEEGKKKWLNYPVGIEGVLLYTEKKSVRRVFWFEYSDKGCEIK